MFLEAIEAYRNWNDDEPEPTVNCEVHYQPEEIPISRACGLLWNRTDILPGIEVSALEFSGIDLRTRTYAAANSCTAGANQTTNRKAIGHMQELATVDLAGFHAFRLQPENPCRW
jgi:hypothetical protein